MLAIENEKGAQLESCKSAHLAHLHCKKSEGLEGLLHHLYAIKEE